MGSTAALLQTASRRQRLSVTLKNRQKVNADNNLALAA